MHGDSVGHVQVKEISPSCDVGKDMPGMPMAPWDKMASLRMKTIRLCTAAFCNNATSSDMLPPRVIWMESTEVAQSEYLGLSSVKFSPAVLSSAVHLTESPM